MHYTKPNLLCYRVAQVAAWVVSTFIFRRKLLRNEIRSQKGAFVVIANHEAALDFVNLIGATSRPMHFVISRSFYDSLPIKGFMKKLGVIPKQQFQTSPKDLKQMKAVIDAGEPVVIYPAGLMCEDGLSTPIPSATYKFLKWLGVDVYVARTTGSYFVMPKWAKGMRPGKTEIDIYKLFSKEELQQLDLETVQKRTDEALLFDAYREQERLLAKYQNNADIRGLENVLYMCPHCGAEFSMEITDRSTIRCSVCGYGATSDPYGFLHSIGIGQPIRYVSDWSRHIYEKLKEKITADPETALTAPTKLHMIDDKKDAFREVGEGTLHLCKDHFRITGTINGTQEDLRIPIGNLPTLPFSPGRHLEIQDGNKIYRCVLSDGQLAMKFINMLKAFYELKKA